MKTVNIQVNRLKFMMCHQFKIYTIRKEINVKSQNEKLLRQKTLIFLLKKIQIINKNNCFSNLIAIYDSIIRKIELTTNQICTEKKRE